MSWNPLRLHARYLQNITNKRRSYVSYLFGSQLSLQRGTLRSYKNERGANTMLVVRDGATWRSILCKWGGALKEERSKSLDFGSELEITQVKIQSVKCLHFLSVPLTLYCIDSPPYSGIGLSLKKKKKKTVTLRVLIVDTIFPGWSYKTMQGCKTQTIRPGGLT
ncbi:hypothetical protein J6590_071906 [Homalodisca vitripennis]|nr:hypothetical protein J6590_071906 [Homalodisca vitripennis]